MMSNKILIVDDSSSIRHMVGLTLKSAGYEVIEAVDGMDALVKAKAGGVGMFVIDLNMPNMDGITLIKELRAIQSFKFTPIAMLTTESQAMRKQEG